VQVCRVATIAAQLGNPQAVTDAGIGALLGEAAVQGGALNVKINLVSIKDEEYVRATTAELQGLLAEAASLRTEALAITLAKL
jgi:formiminotetrahydrofolate cyclodeaminase